MVKILKTETIEVVTVMQLFRAYRNQSALARRLGITNNTMRKIIADGGTKLVALRWTDIDSDDPDMELINHDKRKR